LGFIEASNSEWQWHQLDRMQVCTSPLTDNHASTPPQLFTGWIPFLLHSQQHQITEGMPARDRQLVIEVTCMHVCKILLN